MEFAGSSPSPASVFAAGMQGMTGEGSRSGAELERRAKGGGNGAFHTFERHYFADVSSLRLGKLFRSPCCWSLPSLGSSSLPGSLVIAHSMRCLPPNTRRPPSRTPREKRARVVRAAPNLPPPREATTFAFARPSTKLPPALPAGRDHLWEEAAPKGAVEHARESADIRAPPSLFANDQMRRKPCCCCARVPVGAGKL